MVTFILVLFLVVALSFILVAIAVLEERARAGDDSALGSPRRRQTPGMPRARYSRVRA
jgi:hypothetical protein